jgi:steroid delta-isomerase-like uncharacterized protein
MKALESKPNDGGSEMGREEAIRIIEDFFKAMNEHDVEGMAACCSENVVADEVAEPEPFVGVDNFKKSYSEVFQGYPDCIADVDERFVDGDAVICHVRWRATNSGVFRGSEPTGKKVDLRIAYFFQLKDGRINRITEYYDVATILAQQGQLEL